MKSIDGVGRRSVLTAVGTAMTTWLHGGGRHERTIPKPRRPDAPPENPLEPPVRRLSATVDRIVDGDHVVLLVENRDEIVAQYDVARTTLPTVREGDRVFATIADTALVAVHTETGTRRDISRVQPTAATW